MKKHLLALSLLLAGALSYGQCSFRNGTTTALDNYLAARSLTWGSMPDTTDNLAPATVNQLYVDTIELKWASTTDQLSPSAPSLPITSISITNVTGLPPGMSFVSPSSTADDVYCDGSGASAQQCSWSGGAYACIKIEGTPTSAGTYPVTVSLSVGHLGGPSSGDFAGFKIVVNGPASLDDINENPFQVKQNVPNPFSDITKISYTVKQHTDAKFYVMNLLGEVVYSNNYEANEGTNTINFDGSDLNEGIYMYTIEIDGKKVTKRMIIK